MPGLTANADMMRYARVNTLVNPVSAVIKDLIAEGWEQTSYANILEAERCSLSNAFCGLRLIAV